MKVWVLVVGRTGPLLADAVADYERRAGRYWNLAVTEVREERVRKTQSEDQVREAESARLLKQVPEGAELCALTRNGVRWSSDKLAAYLNRLGLHGKPGVAFMIGGALGLSEGAIGRARHQLSLSSMTFTHDLARLVLLEQLYRAGTIARGEPYHKARA